MTQYDMGWWGMMMAEFNSSFLWWSNQGWSGYGSIPIHTIFRGMNIHLPAILMFTRGIGFWPIPIWKRMILNSSTSGLGWFPISSPHGIPWAPQRSDQGEQGALHPCCCRCRSSSRIHPDKASTRRDTPRFPALQSAWEESPPQCRVWWGFSPEKKHIKKTI